MNRIKNIIFDLGGVLIHLNMAKTEQAFMALSPSETVFSQSSKSLIDSGIFENLETNNICEDDFLEVFLEYMNPSTQKNQVAAAWNAMLITIPQQGLKLIEELRTKGYRLFVLSNTNSIHLREFRKIAEREHGICDFDALFDKTYYSHIVELRKPNRGIYDYVLRDAELIPEETLFIDDNQENLTAAQKTGLNTLLHEPNSDVYLRMKKYLNL
jgi:glucose-1-phosphatase